MTEIQKIIQLFEALQQGDCWIGLNIQEAVAGVDAKTATQKINPEGNSIWQLVNHLIYWRKTVMIRLQGMNALPPMPDFYQPDDTGDTSWQTTLRHFEDVFMELQKTILAFDETRLGFDSPRKGQTYYQLLMGCLQHDAYHMGQMVMLKKGR
ncbi:MAG: DinB family protein [Bacteroidota bacterium]